MMQRRDLIMGGACLAAAGLAVGLRPRRHTTLLGSAGKLALIVPPSFGSWRSQTDDSLVRPETQGRLAARLYSEIVSRIYQNAATGAEVMMLIAYGSTQSDLLQLHRPEICYPAVGFRLAMSSRSNIGVRSGVVIPARRVIAERADRRENIVYWTRLGEYLPTSAGEQRKARLLTAMQGNISDGGLFRFSMLGEPGPSFATLDQFAADMVLAVAAPARPALMGSELAHKLVA